MYLQKKIILDKDNATFSMEASLGRYFNITNIVNENKYLINAMVQDDSPKPPSSFSLVDQSIYGINFTNRIAITLEADDIIKDEHFVCLEVAFF